MQWIENEENHFFSRLVWDNEQTRYVDKLEGRVYATAHTAIHEHEAIEREEEEEPF